MRHLVVSALAVIVALAAFAVTAPAQTTTPITPGVCVHVANCVLYDTAGNTVWSDIGWNSTAGAYTGSLEYGPYPNLVEYTKIVQYPVSSPVDPQPSDTNHILFSAQFQAPNGTLYTEVLKGYAYYYRGGGGRGGGGAGTRYAITSGSITVQ